MMEWLRQGLAFSGSWAHIHHDELFGKLYPATLPVPKTPKAKAKRGKKATVAATI